MFDIEKSLEVMNAAAKVTISNLGSYAPTIYEVQEELNREDFEGVISREKASEVIKKLKSEGKRVAFTNGCFDLLHKGHVQYLNKVSDQGDILFVGLNSDSSIKKIKGSDRPIIDQNSRAFVLSNLKSVDYVVIFEEETPIELLQALKPNVHVKGGDYNREDLPETPIVEAFGGEVIIVDSESTVSTN